MLWRPSDHLCLFKKGAQVHDFLGILSWTFSTFKTFKGAEKNEKLNIPGLLYTVHYVEFTLPSAPRPSLLPLPPPPQVMDQTPLKVVRGICN